MINLQKLIKKRILFVNFTKNRKGITISEEKKFKTYKKAITEEYYNFFQNTKK